VEDHRDGLAQKLYKNVPKKLVFFKTKYLYLLHYTGYSCFTSDNEPDGIENATHNTFTKLTWTFAF
jgi:hypothetical protein